MSAQGIADEARGPGQGPGQPSEEELRAAYEAELSRISATDMMAQATVSLLNIGARRLAPAGESPDAGGGSATHPERDLEQARDAIDAVKALLDILERRIPPQELAPLRDALSRLQMAYAREIGPTAPPSETVPPGAGSGSQDQAAPAGEQPSGERPAGPGPAETSGRLWVPGR